MSTQLELPAPSGAVADRKVMNGKPVHTVPAMSVINLESGLSHKLLCDGPTFSAGSACVYRCTWCYVPDLMRKSPHFVDLKTKARRFAEKHEDMVLRRDGAAAAARKQLTYANGRPKYTDPADRRVIYASPLVDVAGNMELVRETIEICHSILELTNWQIRLLSKSNLLPKVAAGLEKLWPSARTRVIYGVSTGTLDDKLAAAQEVDCPLVSKRLASLHWLQDNGFRTYGMICPSLPQVDYARFSADMAAALRADKCEHVWGEVINARGESFTRTHKALMEAGFYREAHDLEIVSTDKDCWEKYARDTFNAHADIYAGQLGADGKPKLRFLQYVTAASKPWWQGQEKKGAILL